MTRLSFTLLLALAAPLSAQSAAQGRAGDQGASEHRPPPGMCRIWIDGVPAERQPAPTDCATAMRRRPSNARVIFGDEVRPHVQAPPQQFVEPRPNDAPAGEPKSGEAKPNAPRTVDPNANEPHPAPPRVQPHPPVRLPPRPVMKPHKPIGPPMSRIRIHHEQ